MKNQGQLGQKENGEREVKPGGREAGERSFALGYKTRCTQKEEERAIVWQNIMHRKVQSGFPGQMAQILWIIECLMQEPLGPGFCCYL